LTRPSHWEILALALILVMGYGHAVGGYFHAEDMSIIQNIVGPDGALSWHRALEDLTTPQHLESYRPLVSLSHAAVISVVGFDPLFLRSLNIGAQLICALCLYVLVRRLMPTTGSWVPFFAAAFFIVNPLHPEAVTYLVSLAGSGALAFYLLSLCCCLKYLSTDLRRYQILGPIFFVCALGFKEEAISLPFAALLLVLATSWKERSGNSLWQYGLFLFRTLLPYGLVIVSYFLFRWLVLGGLTPGYFQTIEFTNGQLIAGIARYARALLAPINQQALEQGTIVAQWLLCGSIAALLPMLVLRASNSRALWQFIFILLGFLVALIPLYKVVAYGVESNLQNSRYLYFPSVAYSVFLSWLFFAHTQSAKRWVKSVSTGLGITYCLVFLAALVVNNRVWRDAANLSEQLKLASNSATGNDPNIEIINVADSYKGVFFDRAGFHRLFFEPFTAGNLANARRRILRINNDSDSRLQITHHGFGADLRIEQAGELSLNAGESHNLTFDFNPSTAGQQVAELELLLDGCSEDKRRFAVTGEGLNGIPLKTHLAVALSPNVTRRVSGGQERKIAISDLADGIPAVGVRADLPRGVPARFAFREFLESGEQGEPGAPITIADGENAFFVLHIDPLSGNSLPPDLAFVPQIKGLNTPVVTANSQSLIIRSTEQDSDGPATNIELHNVKQGLAEETAGEGSRLQPAVWQTPCGPVRLSTAAIDFGKVSTEPRSWLPQDRVLFFEQPPIQLFWNSRQEVLVPLERLSEHQIVADLLASATPTWMTDNGVHASGQNPLIIRSTSTGGKNLFFREVPKTIKRGTHFLLEARILNTLNPFAFFSWSKAGGADFNATNSVQFIIRPDGNWHTYAISLEGSEVWQHFESADELRLRFVAAHESIDIRRMQIVEF